MTHSVIKLHTPLPRRIWIPLRCQANRRADKDYLRYLNLSSPSLVLQWFDQERQRQQTSLRLIAGSFRLPNAGRNPLVSEPVPLEQLPAQVAPSPDEIAPPTPPTRSYPFQIRIAWLGPRQMGLLVTWPLLSQAASPSGKTWRFLTLASVEEELRPRPEEIVLRFYDWEVLPEPSSWFASLLPRDWLGPVWRCSLQQSTSLELVQEEPDNRQPAAVCLDFGTSTTAASYVQNVSHHLTATEFSPLRDLQCWTHIVAVPDYDNPIRPAVRPGQHQELRLDFHRGELWTGKEPLQLKHLVPEFYTGERRPIEPQNLRKHTIPSLTLVPKQGDGTNPSAITPPTAIIGHEAERLIFQDRLVERLELEACYAPKLEIGKTESDERRQSAHPDQNEAPSARAKEHEYKVQAFLREYFDQLHYKLIREGVGLHQVERICYSFPVVWVKHQREQLQRILEKAVEQSYFGRRLGQAEARAVNPLHEVFSLDEASAAFLGFVQYRMRGLEGEDLVRAYQPFQPHPRLATTYPKACWVLVVDSGGGTTEVALLKLEDPGGMTVPVQSHVRYFFAMPKAGLEVTRQIAQLLKRALIDAAQKVARDESPRIEKYLRTYLNDEGIRERANELKVRDSNTGHQLTEYERRNRMVRDFYDVAETIKIQLSNLYHSSNQASAQLSVPIPWEEKPYLARYAVGEGMWAKIRSYLPEKVDLGQLKQVVREVFDPVAQHIKGWFERESLRKEMGERRIDLLILAGRSSMLPGLREMILEAIPKPYQPYAFDQVTVKNLFFHEPWEPMEPHDAMKTLVQEGLRLLYRNRKKTRGRALISNPPDQTRRSLAIGILQEDLQTGRPQEQFYPNCNLLVEADGENIDPNLDLVYEETNPTSKGFFIGFNYTGTNQRKETEFDRPLPFLRVQLIGGEAEDFQKLRLIFRQIATSEIYLHRVELYSSHDAKMPERSEEVPEVPRSMQDGQKLEISLSDTRKLTIFVTPYPFQEDFRLTGQIDQEIDNPTAQ